MNILGGTYLIPFVDTPHAGRYPSIQSAQHRNLKRLIVKSLLKRSWALAPLLVVSTLSAQPAPTAGSDANGQIATFAKDIGEAYRFVQQLQLQARKSKDVIRLTCINDKLIQMKAVQNIFDDVRARSGTTGSTTEEGLVLEQGRDSWNKMRSLREQAQACVGEVQFQSESKSGWQGPDIPDDPSNNPFPDTPEDPGYASPYN